jgi:hypothetical protein
LTCVRKRFINEVDYVIRRFNASSAGLKKPRGAGPSLGLPLSAISRSNWSPESAKVRPLCKAPCGGSFLVPCGTGLAVKQSNLQQKMKIKNMTTLHSKKSIDRSLLRRGLFLIPLALGCFALLPQARADCQEGCNTSNGNTFLGDAALANNTTGEANTAIGSSALLSNTTGFWNTATGLQALSGNTTGVGNTATGFFALNFNTIGDDNTATGVGALSQNRRGNENTATGEDALQNNRTGNNNTATGVLALNFNNANDNTATGVNALFHNTQGAANTAIGISALFNNVFGSNNIALGQSAGMNITGFNNIAIGNAGVAVESNKIRIGTQGTHNATFVAGIAGVAVIGTQVVVNANGKLGVTTSSARFKEAIRPMDKLSEAILALKPVTFRYKKDIDPEVTPQFGLVAEDVAKVNPDLVVRDRNGEIYSVRYDAVNAMLLNEFLKEHRMVEEQSRKIQQQETTITQLKSSAAKQEATATRQQKQIEALTAGLQKVSAQLELRKPTPRTVVNNQ